MRNPWKVCPASGLCPLKIHVIKRLVRSLFPNIIKLTKGFLTTFPKLVSYFFIIDDNSCKIMLYIFTFMAINQISMFIDCWKFAAFIVCSPCWCADLNEINYYINIGFSHLHLHILYMSVSQLALTHLINTHQTPAWIKFKIEVYMILHELSFNINFYEMSSGNVIKRASIKLNNASGTSFITVYIKMTPSVRIPIYQVSFTCTQTCFFTRLPWGPLHVISQVI